MPKKEQFKVIEESEATTNWNTYLELQAKLFCEREFQLFKSYGFLDLIKKGPVLDLGCGPGLYSQALRKWNDKVRLVSADTNEALLEKFRNRLRKKPDSNIEVVHWSAGSAKAPASTKKCTAVILRYVLQHTHDPVQVLAEISKELRKGTTIFIIEEDDGLYQFYPEFNGMKKLIQVWKRWAAAYKADRMIGRKIPIIASKAGLKVVNFEVLCHSHYQTGIDPLLKYFMLSFDVVAETAPKVLSKMAAKKLAKDFEKFKRESAKDCFFFYPQAITIAKVV
jgi:SAM-dependent methyltransferase